jgi:tape measure domain-containing protein
MAFTVDIRGNASHLEKTLKSVKGSLSDLGGAGVKAITTGLTALGAAGAAAIGAFVVTSSQAAASIEDLAIQFEVLTGSAAKSKELLAQFREEEKKSALSTQDYAEGAKLLLANNVQYEKLLPILRMVGDVSLGNSERFGRLSLAMAQISAKGKLAGQELNQLAESGFNPLQIIAEKTGKSYEELFKMMEAREITVEHVMQALKSATSEGGRFYQAIEKGSAGTTAKLNQTAAAVTQLQVAFGTGFNQGLKDALDATNNFLPKLESKFTEAGSVVGSAITQAVQGNTEQLATIGAFAGEIFFEGFKAFYLKAMDELVAGAQNIVTGDRSDPTGLIRLGEFAAGKMGIDPSRLGLPDRSKTIKGQGTASLQSYMQSAIGNVQGSQSMQSIQQTAIANGIAEGLRKGEITEGMREEVKQGILDAWSKDPNAGRARFSN